MSGHGVFELRRKSDNQLLRAYGSDNTSYISFPRVAAGDYIVKATPIVECGELTPGTYEVTVPYEPIKISDIKNNSTLSKAVPYKMWELQITTSGILWST